jgi:1-aminocyclopropane-1-carboxylate deaminase
MDIIHEDAVVIQPLNKDWYQNKVAAMDMLRLDLIHPIISGNKWFKLKYNLQQARLNNNYNGIITFGGGFSNHLIAAAAAAKEYGYKITAIVRGKYEVLTPTLKDCIDLGMELIFVTKQEYANKENPEWLQTITDAKNKLIIPEGGANEWGRLGAEDIVRYIPEGYTDVCVSVGSGTTLIGLRNALPASVNVTGFVPMKGGSYLMDEIMTHIPDKKKQVRLVDNWHFGGFGKWNSELIDFMNEFHKQNEIPLDIIYTSKMMYGIKELLSGEKPYFNDGARVLCIHTGGLQGNISVKEQLEY